MLSLHIFTCALPLVLTSLIILSQAQESETDVTSKIETGFVEVVQDVKGVENNLLSELAGQISVLANKIDKLSSENEALTNAISSNLGAQSTAMTQTIKNLLCDTVLRMKLHGLKVKTLNGKRYYFSYYQPRMTWYEAYDFCHNHGMDLVSVESQDEWDMLKPEVERLWNKITAPWSSGSDAVEEGMWKWTTTGSDVIFYGGRDMENTTSQNCMFLRTSDWADLPCTSKGAFICEDNSQC